VFWKRRKKGMRPELAEPEELLQISRKYFLQKGKSYIVEDPAAAISYDIFVNLLSTEVGGVRLRGYIVSRQHPNLLRKHFGLTETPITWLATQAGENSLDPTSLGMLTHSIVDFFNKTENSIVLLDGVEYLITNNDFRKVVRILEQINDAVMHFKGRLMVPIDPRAFDMKELAILERYFEVISPKKGIKGFPELQKFKKIER